MKSNHSRFKDKHDLLVKLCKNDSKWTLINESNGITTESKFLEGSTIACFRSYCIIRATPDVINDVWNGYNDIESIMIHDPNVIEYKVIKNINNDTRINYQVNKLPWPLWSREIVYKQHRVLNGNKNYILSYSVDDEILPNQKYVRAQVHIAAYVFEKLEPNLTKITRIVHVEPKGIIPSSIINTYADKNLFMLRKLLSVYG